MTLDEMVLQKLVDWPGPREGRQTLVIADKASTWQVHVTADRHDELSCALWEAALQRAPSVESNDTAALQAWAERAAHRATGLLEPLEIVEIDSQRHEALLRSQEPRRRGEDLYYYEVLLKGTQRAEVRRYQAPQQNGRREQIVFLLTHEGLAKLAADLSAE